MKNEKGAMVADSGIGIGSDLEKKADWLLFLIVSSDVVLWDPSI